ncbi:small polypeptide DEVIL 22 [Capsicum chacoense]
MAQQVKINTSSYMGSRSISKKKNNGVSRKCASLIKEQRARIYILRRCATMLLCWYIQGDD